MRRTAKCSVCGRENMLISANLGVCGSCLRERAEEALPIALRVHARRRSDFGLPLFPPKSKSGVACRLCVNECMIPEGERGYCGLVENRDGRLVRLRGTFSKGLLEWYYDPLPTNCVAAWVCPGCTGAGFPRYAYKPNAEYGYFNLAVFYAACSYDCLFCQNWTFREHARSLKPVMSAWELADKCNERVSCICYFGGDPAVQMAHSIKTSELAIRKAEKWKGLMRICWETNGTMSWPLLKRAALLAYRTGGCIKFDLKAWSETLNIALCGATNRRTLDNFSRLKVFIRKSPDPPFLVASTLLVPGYIDAEEVRSIAGFIADVDPEIPYSLLAFHPHYVMDDLPTTGRRLALECAAAAKEEGLVNVNIGNVHLLADY
ncbi:MAG: radical SAM protein [Candidatus Jordarchaeales archaeon]